MTSLHEGFPIVISESHSFGVPVAMMSLKYLENAKHGCVQVGKNDVDELSEEVIRLLQNFDHRKRIGREGYHHVKNFSNEIIVNKWKELFQ